uniref:Uncharacterized protein n=1 Tax=Eutreptiella gymnastica TaxID=73025 RepID=A0A7S1JED6_9EUGL|mmetsp:Transcript_88354/g.153408  ORF Transcript_88354/g.153408 Transcript_88354/m.153408 type:complete len:117 (+) Transcript_88354:137-487(+)
MGMCTLCALSLFSNSRAWERDMNGWGEGKQALVPGIGIYQVTPAQAHFDLDQRCKQNHNTSIKEREPRGMNCSAVLLGLWVHHHPLSPPPHQHVLDKIGSSRSKYTKAAKQYGDPY